MFYIPEGFAHGFLVLSDTAEFVYKCTDIYKATVLGSIENLKKIRDFQVLDTDDIVTRNPRDIDYSKSVCKIKENDWIKAEWDEPILVDIFLEH